MNCTATGSARLNADVPSLGTWDSRNSLIFRTLSAIRQGRFMGNVVSAWMKVSSSESAYVSSRKLET